MIGNDGLFSIAELSIENTSSLIPLSRGCTKYVIFFPFSWSSTSPLCSIQNLLTFYGKT